jgi:tRNA-dihydrouridine synthase B
VVFRSYLAPIHEYSDPAFRLLCQRYGADAACVPLISSAAIAMDESRISLIAAHPDERNLGVQVFGNDAKMIGKAAGIIAKRLPFVSWLNLNCGCPSSRTRTDGSGSAMLENPTLIAETVSEMKRAAGIPVSVKMRISGGRDGTLAICRKIEDAGADFIIIHGRTPGQGYSGKSDWELIKSVKEGISIPVVGNGDIASRLEGMGRIETGHCDSFMVGRAAMRNPMLFSDKAPESATERFAILREYVSLHDEYRELSGGLRLRDLKLKAMNLLCGIRGAAALRARVGKAASAEEIMALEESAGERE